jgi:PAS fold
MLREAPAPISEAAHLRRILELQPCALMRIGVDGTVLAANDAALRLLGVAERRLLLGTSLPDRLAADDREPWGALVARVAAGESASLACAIAEAGAEPRGLTLQAVPFDHEDGVPSMLLSGLERLEPPPAPAPREDAPRVEEEELARLQSELDYAIAEAQRLENVLSDREADHRTAFGRLEQSLAEEQSLTALLKMRQEGVRRELEAARAELAQARAADAQRTDAMASPRDGERDARLAALEAEAGALHVEQAARKAEHAALQQALDGRDAEVAALQQALGGRDAEVAALQQALGGREAEVETLTQALAAARAEQRRLTADVDRRIEEARQEASAHALERTAALETTLSARDEVADALRDELEAERDEWLQARAALEAQERADAEERARLERLAGEYQIALERQARDGHEQVERLRAERNEDLAAATSRQERTAKALADALVELQAMDECVRGAEAMAASGRLARLVAPELQTMLSGIGGRAARVLALAALGAPERQELEALRRDTVRASVLANQIASTADQPTAAPEPAAAAAEAGMKGRG